MDGNASFAPVACDGTRDTASGDDELGCAHGFGGPAARATAAVSVGSIAVLLGILGGLAHFHRARGRIERAVAVFVSVSVCLLGVSSILTGALAPVTTADGATTVAVAQAVATVFGTGLPLSATLAKSIALKNAIGAGAASRRSGESPMTVLCRVVVFVAFDLGIFLLLVFPGGAVVSKADIESKVRRPESRWLVAHTETGRVALIVLGLLRLMQCVRAMYTAGFLAQAEQRLARRAAVSLRVAVATCVLSVCTLPAVQSADSEMSYTTAWMFASCGPALGLVVGMHSRSMSKAVRACFESDRRKVRDARRTSRDGSGQAFLAAPVRVATVASTLASTAEAVKAMTDELVTALGGERPSVAVVFYTQQHDPADVRRLLLEALPGTPFVGSSTCRGVMKDATWVSEGDRAMGIWGLFDAEGAFAVGGVDLKGLTPPGITAAVDAEAARVCARAAPAADDVTFDAPVSTGAPSTAGYSHGPTSASRGTVSHENGATPEVSPRSSAAPSRVSAYALPAEPAWRSVRAGPKPAEAEGAFAVPDEVVTTDHEGKPMPSPSASARARGRPLRRPRYDAETRAQPGFVWLNAPPGVEEFVMDALRGQAGPSVPITGGSSADNKVRGGWSQICSEDGGVYTHGAVFAMCWPIVEVRAAFLSSYSAHRQSGIVTSCEGPRCIVGIDGRPAAEVYNRWTGGILEGPLAASASTGEPAIVLKETSLRPLGHRMGYGIDDEPFFKLMHLHAVRPDGAITTFANVAPGQRLHLMGATKELIIRRVGRCASQVIRDSNVRLSEVKGAIGTFCAGCMLTAKDEMGRAAAQLSKALSGAPVMGLHGFGEQGQFPNGESHHGNLMYSTLIILSRRIRSRVARQAASPIQLAGSPTHLVSGPPAHARGGSGLIHMG